MQEKGCVREVHYIKYVFYNRKGKKRQDRDTTKDDDLSELALSSI